MSSIKQTDPDVLWTDIQKYIPYPKEIFFNIKSYFNKRTIDKNDYLISQGYKTSNNFFIIKGCVKAVHVNADYKEHVIYFAMENHWISDYNAFWHQKTSSLSVVAIECCELLSISFDNQRILCNTSTEMDYYFAAKSNELVISQQQRIISMLKDEPIKRFDLAKRLYPEIYNRIPQHLIASYLGVSRETLNRCLSIGASKTRL